MAIARIEAQGVQQRGTDPQFAVLPQLQFGGDLIHLGKTHLQRFPAEQVGILRQGIHCGRAQVPEHLHRPGRRDTEAAQPGNGLPHPEHTLKFMLNGPGFFRGNAPDKGKLFRIGGNYIQGLHAKPVDNLARRGRADIGQRPAGQIHLQSGQVLRHSGFAALRLKLKAIGFVFAKGAVHGNGFAFVHLTDGSGNRVEFPIGSQFKNGVAGFTVLVDNPRHRSLQRLQRFFHLRPPPLFAVCAAGARRTVLFLLYRSRRGL